VLDARKDESSQHHRCAGGWVIGKNNGHRGGQNAAAWTRGKGGDKDREVAVEVRGRKAVEEGGWDAGAYNLDERKADGRGQD